MQAITLLNTRGRTNTNKVVVLMTDGKPNLYSSSNTTISSYRKRPLQQQFLRLVRAIIRRMPR